MYSNNNYKSSSLTGIISLILIAIIIFVVLVAFNVIDSEILFKSEEVEVQLSVKSLEMRKGEETHLEPIKETGDIFKYKSSDSNVVSVNEITGYIKAVSYGTATITVQSEKNPNIKDECIITVVNTSNYVNVSNISLSATKINLTVGGKKTLYYTISPRNANLKRITWSTSNNNVATIDKYGTVKAVGVGEATIRIKTDNGKTAICVVYVSNKKSSGSSASGSSQPTTGSNTGGSSQPTTGSNTGGSSQPTTGSNTGGSSQPTTGSNTGGSSQPTTGTNTGGSSQPTTGSNTGGSSQPVGEANVTKYYGYNEGIAVIVNDDKPSKVRVFHSQDTTNWKEIDRELIRKENGKVRADILGLNAGKHNIKVIDSQSREKVITGINVTAYDRSGYAHYGRAGSGYENGVGAYNDDGTIKTGAIVLYLTEANKNTISLNINGTTYKGIVKIVENLKKLNGTPVVIRIIGKISAPQLKTKTWSQKSDSDEHIIEVYNYFRDSNGNCKVANCETMTCQQLVDKGLASWDGYTKINGLACSYKANKTRNINGTNYPKYGGFVINNLPLFDVKNITIEGVGTNAELYQIGLRFRRGASIEVRNLKFSNFPDTALTLSGAVAIEGKESDDYQKGDLKPYGYYWIHHNTFNPGLLKFDTGPEYTTYNVSGGYNPDETTGSSYAHNVTFSYNYFNGTYKAHLIGMNDNSHQYNYTLHHNYYRNVYQRVPKARMVNIHAYNNYFKGSVVANVDLTYDAVMYSEYNYYENIKSPVFYINRLSAPGTSTKVKSFKDHFDVDTSSNRFAQVWIGGNEKSISNGIFIASSRGDTKKIGEGKNYVDTARNYCNFDTNVKGLFYYNSSSNSSAVSTIWTNTNKVKTNLPGIVGVLKDK